MYSFCCKEDNSVDLRVPISSQKLKRFGMIYSVESTTSIEDNKHIFLLLRRYFIHSIEEVPVS